MSKIFLGGGGNEEQSKDFDKLFVQSIPKEKRILYIPLALNPADYPPKSCLEWLQKGLSRFGKVQITIVESEAQLMLAKPENFDAVYIGGGNTFKLLKLVKDTKFDQKLINYFQKGGIIYGGSAGALILTSTITLAAYGDCCDVNEVMLSDLTGLDLCQGKTAWCHYTSKDDALIKKMISQFPKGIYALPEESGIIIDKNVTPVGECYFFDRKGKRLLTNP